MTPLLEAIMTTLKDNFHTTACARTALLMTGLKLDPTNGEQLMNAALATSVGIDPFEPAEGSRQWHLYVAVTDLDCPIHCIGIAPWLVSAVCSYTKNQDFKFEELDPADWTNGLAEVWAKFPEQVKTKQANDLIEAIIEAAEAVPERDLDMMRSMLQRKAEAIASGNHKHAHDHKDTLH